MATVSQSYNARAATYDDTTSFHRNVASKYVKYASPQPGETLLDLACGTGLVTLQLLPFLQSQKRQPAVVGVDISPGMLSVARSKLAALKTASPDLHAKFVEHDITALSAIPELDGTEGCFDIVTVCSALVLLQEPGEALKHWSRYLRSGGRMVVDIPHTQSMLALKVLDLIGPEFGLEALGSRSWIRGPESLRALMEEAGLEARIEVTEVFGDIPARTEEGRCEWRAEEGGEVWDRIGERMSGWDALGGSAREQARVRFLEEWGKLAGADGIVREEGRLYVGIGIKR